MEEGRGSCDSLETEFACCWLRRYRPGQIRGCSCPSFTSLTPLCSQFFVCFLLFSFFFFAMVSFICIISISNRKERRALGSGRVLGVVADLEI